MINDTIHLEPPPRLGAILADSQSIGFSAFCEEKTGVLLRMLAASKPGGRILELGTGTGVAACWMLDGADSSTSFTSVENDAVAWDVAHRHLGPSANARFLLQDAHAFIDTMDQEYDLVFADTFPGKFLNRDSVLDHIKVGGFYVVDDLLPQANWPDGDHPLKVRDLIRDLEADSRFKILKLNWASGIVVCSRRG